jgi:hypothetical protein
MVFGLSNRHYYSFFFVLGAALFLSWLYCPLYDLGMSDKEIFTYAGWAVSKGLVPYRDFFDHKPPLIYFFNAAGLALGGVWGIWLINTSLALLVTGFFFNCCRKYRLPYPWLLPLLFNLMLRDNLISEGNNMTREYTAFFYMLFFCILLTRSRYRYFLLGLFSGLTFFMQQDQVLPLFPFLLYVLLSGDTVGRLKRFVLLLAGALAVSLPIILYFALHRSLGYFWEQAFLFNLKVYTAEKKSVWDHFKSIKHVLDAGNYELPFMIAICLGILALTGQSKKKGLILAAFASLLLTFSAELMGGRYNGEATTIDYFYYFLPLSASVCSLLFAVFAFSEDFVPRSRAAQLPYVLLLCCSLTYTAFQHATHLLRRDRNPVIDSPELNYLRQHRPGNYQLYVFEAGGYVCAYYEFRILAPSRWLYQHFWNWYANWDADGQILRSIGQDLLQHHTTYVIMDPEKVALFRNPANYQWWMSFIQTHYQQVPMPGSLHSILWKWKDTVNMP